jgi:hypothetical protein
MNIKPKFLTLFIWILLFAELPAQEASKPARPDSTGVAQAALVPADSSQSEASTRLFLDKIEVEGRLEKPQAVFIIPGVDPEIDDVKIERSFFEDIFRPIERKGRIAARPAPGQAGDRKDVLPW